MEETKKADFQFKGFVIKKSLIELNDSREKRKLDIKIHPSGLINKTENTYELTLRLEVNEKGANAHIDVEAIGKYTFVNNLGDNMLNGFFFLNAPAILFPYLRSYISTLTTLSGTAPINLPTLNLTGLRGQLKQNTKTIE